MDSPIPSYISTALAGSIPASVLKTGTVLSVDTILTGSGTQFTVQAPLGSYIYSQNQVRLVVAVASNTKLTLNKAFSPNLAASTPLYVIDGSVNNTQSIINIGVKTALLGTSNYDAQSLIVGGRVKYSSPTIGPIAYNPNGSILIITNGEFDVVDLGASINSLVQLQNNLELLNMTSEQGIVAHAGGGQADATQLTCQDNRVDTVASAGDSVRLVTAIKNTEILVQNNDPLNSMDVFPSIADNILGSAVNIAYPIVAGNQSRFFCFVNGEWTLI